MDTDLQTYTTTMALPEPVAAYFTALTRFGNVSYQPHWVTAKVLIEVSDLYDLANVVRQIEITLGQVSGLAMSIERPVETDTGHYLATVPLTDDTRTFFDAITGLAAADYTPGEPTLTVTFQEVDKYDLGVTVQELKDLLSTEFRSPIDIPRPALVS